MENRSSENGNTNIEDFVENLKNKFPVLPAVENAYNKCL